MRWIPEPFQLTALSFLLVNPYSGLFLDPGLGKTSICLSAIRILQNIGRTKGNLVIAPLRVIYEVWPEEISKWGNFNGVTYSILHEDNKKSIWTADTDIYLINPEGIKWLYEELLAGLSLGDKCPFNALWIDESSKFKVHDSMRFELLSGMLPLFKERHIMTGTPAPKSLMNLWSQIYLLDKGSSLSPNFYDFRKKYFTASDWNQYNWDINDGAADIISKKVSPIVLEMKSEGRIKLPPLVYNPIKVSLPKNTLKRYKQMERDYFAQLDEGEVTAQAAAQASMKCHQMANGKIYEDIPEDISPEEKSAFIRTRKVYNVHSRKAEALADLVDELEGKPLLVAYHFKHDLKAMEGVLGGPLPNIGSGASPKRVRQLRGLWNAGKLPVLAGHPASMGYGLNMQYGQGDVCWYSLPWSLEHYIQFNKRLQRRGVRDTVRVHHLIARNTVDEAIVMRLGKNAEAQEDLRNSIRRYRKQLRQ